MIFLTTTQRMSCQPPKECLKWNNILTVFIAIYTTKTIGKMNTCIGFVLVDHAYREFVHVQHQKPE